MQSLRQGLTTWLNANLSVDGHLPYRLDKDRKPLRGDNAIRRFLASWAMARAGMEGAELNLEYNLGRFMNYTSSGVAVIVEGKVAKVGALACAGLAALEVGHEVTGELAASVKLALCPRRGFHTFFWPLERDGQNWNFYAPEALLFSACALEAEVGTGPTHEQCLEALDALIMTHRANRNPVFAPWAMQACEVLWRLTADKTCRDFAIELADWLSFMQQADGRFYDPGRPDFGPPHSSSTAVYMEGYRAATAVADYVGDLDRQIKYRQIRQLGEANLLKLQRKDGSLDIDFGRPDTRLDCMAHALLAVA